MSSFYRDGMKVKNNGDEQRKTALMIN